jgi:hypothetical protein
MAPGPFCFISVLSTEHQFRIFVKMQAAAIQDLEGLKHYLKKAAPHRPPIGDAISTGISSLDQMIGGGFPKGAITVLTGLSGAGRMSLAAKVLGEKTRQKHAVAWIDAKGTLYPPALERFGVNLSRLLMVRPEKDRAMYAMHQIADSGVFGAIVMSGGRIGHAGLKRVQTSIEAHKLSAIFVLDPKETADVPCALRLRVTRQTMGIVVEVEKNRYPSSGRMFIDLAA